jgi:hypothetical protein
MQLVDGKKPATWGLIKFSPYCDFQTPCFDYFGDAYCAAGMETAAAAFKAAGLDAEAERIAKETALYRADILASMDAAIIERGGMRILPMEPETLRLLKDSRWRGGGYYGLIASCMLESGLLAPEDPRALTVMDFIRKKGGLILGMSEFAGGIDHAYTYGYWMNCLRRGLAEPVILGFYGSLAYGMSRETFAGVEVTHLKTGDNEATLPHLYSCTQQLRLLRGMLLREEGSDLVIGGAIPRPWLGDGKTIEVERAPTFFGPLAFRLRSEIAAGRIVARIECPAARPARSIFLRLRPPGSPAIRGIDVQGEARGSFSGDTVRLDAPRGVVEITVRY